MPYFTKPERAGNITGFLILFFLTFSETTDAQQFNSDNQWTAPHGVGTFIATAGQEYSQLITTFALIPDWEFNAQFTHYYEDPRDKTNSHTAANLYFKHRLQENEAQTAGYAIMAGTGLFPEYQQQGQTSNAFKSYWINGIATYAFANDTVFLDILPGAALNIDDGEEGDTAWGFTYSSRLAVYDVIPQSAIVGEVFGATGEAYTEPSYRFGVRWESPKWVVAVTYSDAFDGSDGAGFEVGVMYFTDPRFCFRGCSR